MSNDQLIDRAIDTLDENSDGLLIMGWVKKEDGWELVAFTSGNEQNVAMIRALLNDSEA